MSEFDRKSLVNFEIDIPFCQLRYGETNGAGTCPAALGVDSVVKCWNTRATCPVPLSFNEGIVTLRYGLSAAYRPKDIDCIPSLLSAEISPGTIRPGESLGERSTLTVTFADGPHPDTGPGYDKYRSERDYDPVAQGSYWGKFRARQPYLRGLECRIRQGYLGQALEEFETRTFFVESFEGPTLSDRFTIVAKDVFKFLDGDRAMFPEMSNGFLVSDIAAGDLTLTVSPAGIGVTYAENGYLNIGGSEIVAFQNETQCLLLLHMKGADASTTFTDSGPVARTVTAHGNAQIDTAQSKFGASGLFDGSGDYLSVPASADWAPSGDFTIDFWLRPDGLADFRAICSRGVDNNNKFQLFVAANGRIIWEVRSGGVEIVGMSSPAAAITNLSQQHVALERYGDVWTIYVAGVPKVTTTDSSAIPDFASDLIIGGDWNGTGNPYKGWIEEFRVSNSARYRAGFTPATVAYTADVMTITRAQFNTAASAHKAQDRVQTAPYIFGEDVGDIIQMLMVDNGDVPAEWIPIDDWHTETEGFLGTVYTALIPEPTPVKTLIDELIQQAALCVWPDDVAKKVRLAVLRAISTDAKLFNERNLAKDTPLGIREQPDKRLSQAWTRYAQINPLKAIDDEDNFRSQQVTIDGEAETNNGSSAIKVLNSRWIPQNARAVAQKLNFKLLARFRTAPRSFTFATMRGTDSDVELGRGYNIGSPLFQGPDGARVNVPVQVVRLSPMRDRFLVEAEEMRFEQLDEDIDPGGHLVIIDSDGFNIDGRALHDSQFDEAESGDIVTFQINAGVTVGSTSTSIPALLIDDGWASGVTIILKDYVARFLAAAAVVVDRAVRASTPETVAAAVPVRCRVSAVPIPSPMQPQMARPKRAATAVV